MFARRSRRSVGSRSAWVVAKEDLILAKLAWAAEGESALQLRDVRNLLASGVDRDYLRHWSRRIGLEALLERCMDEGHDA